MNPRVLLTMLLLLCMTMIFPVAAGAQWSPDAPKAAATAVMPATAADVQAPAEGNGQIGLFQRRKLGLTVANITPIVKKLKAEGKWSGDPAVDSVTVAEELAKKAPKEYAALNAPNWDNILAFIEKILPLILKLIDIFSYAPPAFHLVA